MSANDLTEVPHTIGCKNNSQCIVCLLKVITIGWSHLQSESNKPLKFVYFGRVGYYIKWHDLRDKIHLNDQQWVSILSTCPAEWSSSFHSKSNIFLNCTRQLVYQTLSIKQLSGWSMGVISLFSLTYTIYICCLRLHPHKTYNNLFITASWTVLHIIIIDEC